MGDGLASNTGTLGGNEGFSILGFFWETESSRSSLGGDTGAGLFLDANRASRSASIAARSRPIIPGTVVFVGLAEVDCVIEVTFLSVYRKSE